MAYAVVVSLKSTIYSLAHSPLFSLIPYTKQILKHLHYQTALVQEILKRSNGSDRLDAFEPQIRDAAYRLEDALEFYESELLSVELESFKGGGVHLDVVVQEIFSFLEMARECSEGLLRRVPEEDKNDDDGDGDDGGQERIYVPTPLLNSGPAPDGDGAVMIGHATEFTEVRDHLLERLRPDDMCFFTLVGEAGAGRSVVAEAFFEGEKGRFECCAWLTIGTHYSIKEIALLILHQLDSDDDHESLLLEEEEEEDEETVCKRLYKRLEHRRYMIVLDDIRDEQVLDRLRSSFPDQSNGSLVLLTTNQKRMICSLHRLHTLLVRVGDFESWGWFYLILAVIGEESGPISAEFERLGKEINANCGGCRLALAKTLLFLNKEEKTEEKWREMAADKEHPIFKVEDEILEMHRIKTEMQSHKWNMDVQRECLIVALIPRWINFSPDVALIKSTIHPTRFFSKMEIISLWGMAGIGKTTYAKKVIQDESILSIYDHCVWVTLGPKYRPEEIMIDILAQIYSSEGKMRMKNDDNLVKKLCVKLSTEKCLIVLDDLWGKEPLQHLKNVFPDIKGRALVTTRLKEVTEWGENDRRFKVRFLDKEESWALLRQKMFGEGSCHAELEKAGRKIAENCDGLPLLILKVADQLLKTEKDQDYWNHVASGKESSVFTNAHDEISKALLPSYKILPQHLKACFLYMGFFHKRYDIPVSKLTDILIAEGFFEDYFAECLAVLESKSVVMVRSGYLMKSCRLHSVFWHMCNNEAVKNKFFHAMNGFDDCSIENVKSQRRLCIRASILLAIKDVQESIASAKSARSFLCVGPPHQYPVPICFGLRLPRVIDALAIRQYEFPEEAVKLLHLRYLALTYCGELPTSISRLWKLQFLIVSRYVNIVSSENSSLLPKEIWDMKELKHLQIMGGCLPNPDPEDGAGLPNLIILLDMSAQSCTREVLAMIPNLKRLGIRIELAPDDEGNSFDCLNNISGPCKLVALKCVVVNPQFDLVAEVPRAAPISMFPPSLKRLSLSGFGFPWQYMSIIGRLENLEVLKLKNYAFQGPKWEIKRMGLFKNLQILLIEDTDLVHWEIKVPSFPKFEILRIRHCYQLLELPIILDVKKVEIVDCSPSAVTWAEQMRLKVVPFPLTTQLSWIDPKVHVAAAVEE